MVAKAVQEQEKDTNWCGVEKHHSSIKPAVMTLLASQQTSRSQLFDCPYWCSVDPASILLPYANALSILIGKFTPTSVAWLVNYLAAYDVWLGSTVQELVRRIFSTASSCQLPIAKKIVKSSLLHAFYIVLATYHGALQPVIMSMYSSHNRCDFAVFPWVLLQTLYIHDAWLPAICS